MFKNILFIGAFLALFFCFSCNKNNTKQAENLFIQESKILLDSIQNNNVELKKWVDTINTYLIENKPIIPLKGLSIKEDLAQKIAIDNPAFCKNILDSTTKTAYRNEIFNVYQARPQEVPQGIDISKIYKVEMYNYAGNFTTTAMVDLGTQTVANINTYAQTQPDIPDSESLLFSKLKKEYLSDFPNLIDRSNFNRRRKNMAYQISVVSQEIAKIIDPSMSAFIIDSIPIPICKNTRIPRSKNCKEDPNVPPARSYNASHKVYFYGFKMQLIINKLGVPFSVALTSANLHDVKYLDLLADVEISDCELIGDMGYLSESRQLNLFETQNIKLITPKRSNMSQLNVDWNPAKRYQRKRIETLFSQLDDQMMIKRNYAKSLIGLLTRVTSKVSAVAILQMINFKNEKQLNKIKHALAA